MLIFWDASGLAKRYSIEEGSATVNAIFAQVSHTRMTSTPWGYIETYSLLLRRYNSGILKAVDFTDAVHLLEAEVGANANFALLSVSDDALFASIAVMHKHNLNSTDAAILAMLLRTLPSPVPPDFVLIAADKRLLRAASAEGMKTLDPAALPAPDVPAFLAALDAEALKDVFAENRSGNQEETDL